MNVAERMGRLGTESAFEVLARARALERQGREIVHLEIGEPDFDTPAHIKDAAKRALDANATHYGPSAGLPELREAIAKHTAETRGVPVSPEQVVVTPGAKPIMFFTILALCQPGDEVLYPDPGFPMYESIAAFAGARPVPVPLREANGFRMDPGELASLVTARTRLVILNSPHNPCGSGLTQDDVEAIAAVAMEHDLVVLSDEVYWAIRYGGSHPSVLSVDGMDERTVLLDGWSKTFAMTGWRLGFGVLPADLVEPVTRLVVNSVSCTAAFSQHAAVAALEGPWAPVEAMVATLRARRDVVVAGLGAIDGLSCQEPAGAFYAFPRVADLGLPAARLADLLLAEGGVACLPGTAFGANGEGYLRLSYATTVDNLRRALARIERVAAAAPGRGGP
jgi:aspartate aminotransferase